MRGEERSVAAVDVGRDSDFGTDGLVAARAAGARTAAAVDGDGAGSLERRR